MKSISKMLEAIVLILSALSIANAEPLASFMPASRPKPETRVYKRIGDVELELQVFRSGPASNGTRRPAIVWIHGGAWVGGTTEGTAPHAAYFASRGMVAFNINYRLARPGAVTVGDCLADCRSALRYLRGHAAEFGIDPERIAVTGDSAGGHLAACLGTLLGFDNPGDDLSISGKANAMILYNPITDMSEGEWIRYAVGGRALADKTSPIPGAKEDIKLARSLSPLFNVAAGQPPAIILHGSADTIVPVSQSERFAQAAESVGNRCDLVRYDGIGHAFVVAAYKSPESVVVEAIRAADQFLRSLGWLVGPPTLTISDPPAWKSNEKASIPVAPLRTPVNQVFQFIQAGTCSSWSDGSKNEATAYLWIPEKCKRLRGLLVLCANVPEHGIVGHPAIREVCRSNDLGIVWCTPSFMNFARQQPGGKKMTEEHATTVAFLQQLLDGLAKTSGYDEVATVPWLPMGESGHLLMVDALVEAKPERCIAGIWIKNNHLPPHNREVPALVAFGTAQEWSQDKTDIRTKWNDVGGAYAGILNERKKHPGWPLSYVIDGSSGHFDCSERLIDYFARYIDLVAKARLSKDGSPTLAPVDTKNGYLAGLPVPGHEIVPLTAAGGEERSTGLPWYFDEATAREAQAIAAINWKAETQFPAFVDDDGMDLPHTFNGITNLRKFKMEADDVTFSVRGRLLEQIPADFVGAGGKLAVTPGVPLPEWLCGPVEPLGGGRFRIALDRVWLGGGATYVALRQAGSDTVRSIVQPAGIDLRGMKNQEGAPQKITFDPIGDVKVGLKSVELSARSDSGLPVSYFVVAGPAMIHEGSLQFTEVPPRTRFPVDITVAAWQWGRSTDPKIKTAEIVKQTIRLVR